MEDLKHVIPFFIPIIAIVMGIGIGMLALLLDYQKKRHIIELNHKERLVAIERGMELPPLPPECFGPMRKNDGSRRMGSLLWGLLWLLVGLAIGVAMWINDGPEQASWALWPIAVGAALLIYYRAVTAADKAQALKA